MKIRLTNATFSAAAKTIAHSSFSDVTLSGIQVITNVTDQIIIYNFADTTKGGTLSVDTLTLEYDTTSMSDTDELMILVEDGATTQPVSAASLPLPTDAATQTTLALIKAKTDNIPALGQALAASSVPIVLTAAQETALTPPAAITGFATSAKQDILLTELQLKADLTETQPVSLASVPSHAVTNAGTFAVQATEADGANVTLGAKADAKSTATDTTAITIMQVLKQISASVQAPPSQAVTGTFYQATQPVSATSLPLPTGASTSALQGGGLPAALGAGGGLKIDGSGTSLPVTEASASAIKTAVELIDNAIAGTEMQVDVVAALPAGTNAIGKLLPPDVDVTTHTNYIKKYYTNAGAVTDGIIWSPAAGKRWHITTLYLNVSAAATVTLEDDLAAGDSAVWKGELAANSGVVINFGEKYPLASGEDASDLIITTSAGNCYVTCVGYEI